MIKTIDNVRYSSKAGTLVGESDGVKLMHNKAGRYFLFDGEKITPMSYEGAKDWAWHHEGYEHFEVPKKTETKSNLSLYVRDSTIIKLQQNRAKTTESIGEAIDRLVELYLEV